MIPASANYQEALKASHVALTRAVVLNPQSDNTYAPGDELAIASGSLSVDGTRNIWRQANLVLAPTSPFLLDPLDQIDGSTRLRIDRGIRMFNGIEEWVTVAVLQVQEASRGLNEGTLRVQAYDLGALVQDYDVPVWNPLSTTRTPLTSVEAIQHLVNEAMWDDPAWVVDVGIDLAAEPPEGTTFSGNRWNIINSLAKSLGAVVNAEYDGSWRIRKVENNATPFTVVEGDGGVLVDRTVKQSRREMFNAVTVTWESPSGSGTVFVVDADPNSATFWDGPWGRKTAPVQRLDTVTSEAQAIDAAYALLEQYKGASRQIDFKSVHNPLIEPFDVVRVQGITRNSPEEHVMDSVQYPLSGGEMSAETRQVS